MTNRRVCKISEFVAHGSNVTCLSIGRKHNRLAVTGGEDKKVNLWTLNKPTCIMSLTGHTTTVQTVTFSNKEDKIVSGSVSGTLKVWDLEVKKLICNLVGHKSNVSCLEFHAYADYIASGSMDMHIRLWDMRRKGCIFTYKGHSGCVNSLKFSPDSKWIASVSEDGTIKIWDLKAGKLLSELKGHTAGINSLEFHPNEFLLATGSTDRTVKFWDLEKMDMISSTPQSSSSIKAILFEPSGKCLFAGSQDYLHSYSWEPVSCHDTIFCQWKQVNDLTWADNKLIGSSFTQNLVSFYNVDLTQVSPIGEPSSIQQQKLSTSDLNTNKPSSNANRKNFLYMEAPVKPVEQIEEYSSYHQCELNNDDNSMANICNQDEYNKIFRPQKELIRLKGKNSQLNETENCSTPENSLVALKNVEESATAQLKIIPTGISNKIVTVEACKLDDDSKQKNSKPENKFDIDMQDFMPKIDNEAKLDAMDLVSNIDNGHDSFMKAIRARYRNITNLRNWWTSGNIKEALDAAVSLDDISVIADILNQLNQIASFWTLDICSILLPPIKKLIDSKYEEHMQIGCDSCKLIFKNFSKLIKANLTTLGLNNGVDLSREERQRKCRLCYGYLSSIVAIIEQKTCFASTPSKILNNFREISLLMKTLE